MQFQKNWMSHKLVNVPHQQHARNQCRIELLISTANIINQLGYRITHHIHTHVDVQTSIKAN